MSRNSEQIETISYTIDETARQQNIRHTLQPKTQTPLPETPERPRSLSLNKKTHIVIEPPIPETEAENEDAQGEVQLGNDNNSLRTSFMKKPPSRNNSYAGVRAKITEVKGYDNGAYGDGGEHFQRGYVDSNRSSTHSMQVQREQYCCCSKWSPFERRLATSVGILAAVIIGLAVTVGLLAQDEEKGIGQTFMWKP